ncbi:hypothetical protein KHA80_07620 [Anaerobacillus sp. HL2]|nr:hypothetical protein KHA80_07620 [Anaerobacillus sp. HL2]
MVQDLLMRLIKQAFDETDDAHKKASKRSEVWVVSRCCYWCYRYCHRFYAAIATGASLIKLGDEYNMAVNQISASNRSYRSELEELGEVAQNVYKHNFGDSLEDVLNGISEVKKGQPDSWARTGKRL